jgi:hypothetical protein
MADESIQDQLTNLLGKFSKQQKKGEEEISFVRDLKKFEPEAIENHPKLEIRYQIFHSTFGAQIITRTNDESKKSEDEGGMFAPLLEGSVPVISDPEKLLSLVGQLDDDSKRSELLKYGRIKRQSEFILAHRKSGKKEEEIEALYEIFPPEYDINLTIVPFNIKGDDRRYRRSMKIYTNRLKHVEELDRQLTIFRDEAMNALLDRKIRSHPMQKEGYANK